MSDMDAEEILVYALIIGLVVIASLGVYRQAERNELIDECEKDLPRSERCILIAVPQEKDDE